MILAVDVSYVNSTAFIAGLVFSHWSDDSEQAVITSHLEEVQQYLSGQFYLRELPCILKLLEEHQLQPDCIVIDGFVYLDGISEAGLGKHLYDALHGKVAVIGVAKRPLVSTPAACAVYRGVSQRPLYVTSVGIEPEKARQYIKLMHGEFRIPDLLKKVDQICRQHHN